MTLTPTGEALAATHRVSSKNTSRKEKNYCFRCGFVGHFVVHCTAELCDNCLKPGHESDDCPLLTMPKPVVTIYGVCNNRLMFFESPCSNLRKMQGQG